MISKDRVKQRYQELYAESEEHLEELKIRGKELAARVRELVEEGKVRKITLKKGDRILAEFPLVLGIGGTAAALVIAPTIAAIGAICALVADVSVIVHRTKQDPDDETRSVTYTEVEE